MTRPARTAEHDAFGPWVDVVRTPEDVPRLFRPHGVDPTAARRVLKVPRDIPRRDTDPGMDLYEHLIVVGDRDLEVLSREGSGYGVRRIPFAELAAVRDRVDLLDGLLTLHTVDGASLWIPFNGSSREVVVELTELLIGLASASADLPGDAPRGASVAPRVDLGPEEAGVAAAYFDAAARDPQLRYLSSHPRTPLRSTATGIVGALHRLRPMSLAGAVAARTPRELLVLTRRDAVVRRRTATLSIDRLHILRHALTSATSSPHPRWADLSIVTIRAGASSFDLVAATSELEGDLLTAGG